MLGLTFDNGFAYGFFGNVLGTINLITKGIIGVTVMMWVRWTLPRLRIDQVITTCLKYCVPIAAVAFLIVTLWQYALPNRVFFGLMNLSSDSYQVREQLAPA
jgi:NADH-quinone oxidoreductase subunit H